MTIPVCSIVACVLILASRSLTQSPPNPVLDANKTAVKEIQNGNIVHAIQLLEEAVKRDRQNAKIYYNLGTAYFLLKELGKAHAALAKAVELEPNSTAVLNQLGLTQLEEGDYTGSIQSFRSAIAKQPNDPFCFTTLDVFTFVLRTLERRSGSSNVPRDWTAQIPKFYLILRLHMAASVTLQKR